MHPDVFRYSSSSSPSISQLKGWLVIDDSEVQSIADQMKSLWIKAICDQDLEFPAKVRKIRSAPYILYYQWDISLLNKPILGVVWPRQPSIYAGKILDRMFKIADRYNLVTISGLATWVDQLAHRLSIERGIPTIAVLWGGLWEYLQRSDRHLIASIVEHGGLVISEFRLFQAPETYTFPQRNRIIAGLSDVLFLPEAGKKSGSLITVDFAHKMGVPIYGTPYDIFSPESQWLHTQISLWIIKPLFDLDSLFKNNFSLKAKIQVYSKIQKDLSPSESLVIRCLHQVKSCSLEYLSSITKTSPSTLLWLMSVLEIKALVRQSSPGIYSIL